MELISTDVARHLEALVPPRESEMRAMEAHARDTDFPIIGPAAGYFCYLVARLISARSVFEMGSGFGYSTAWFAQAVRDNGGGVVHHVVWDEKLSAQARTHLERLGLLDVVRFHVGEAVETLRHEHGPFDLIFDDIDKEGYPASVAVAAEKLRAGGVLIADNALWHGRIFDQQDRSAQTEGVREMTRILTEDENWTTSLVPIRDGLLVARRN